MPAPKRIKERLGRLVALFFEPHDQRDINADLETNEDNWLDYIGRAVFALAGFAMAMRYFRPAIYRLFLQQ